MGGFDFGSLFGGIGSWLKGKAEAKGYKEMAKYYREAARVTLIMGGLKSNAIQRQIYQVAGQGTAVTGAAGVKLSGSALDAVKQNTQQGYLTKAITAMNTQLEYKSYIAQAKQAEAMAKAAKSGGFLGLIGGIMGIFSDDDLKENIVFLGRRPDGLGVYRFNYKGGTAIYEGVMASEVAVLYPDAVSERDGYRVVNYHSIGVELRKVA